MNYKIKSHAKINLALNVIGKNSTLHKIESIIAFIDLYDVIKINLSNSNKHNISFHGKFSRNIGSSNTISKLLSILEKKKLIENKKFNINVKKKIPNKAGFGGGSMNAASILRFFAKKKIIKTTQKELKIIASLIGSDVILGLNPINSILTKKNEVKYIKQCKKFHILLVKPNFGCSSKEIYSRVRRFDKPKISNLNKNIFSLIKLKNNLIKLKMML